MDSVCTVLDEPNGRNVVSNVNPKLTLIGHQAEEDLVPLTTVAAERFSQPDLGVVNPRDLGGWFDRDFLISPWDAFFATGLPARLLFANDQGSFELEVSSRSPLHRHRTVVTIRHPSTDIANRLTAIGEEFLKKHHKPSAGWLIAGLILFPWTTIALSSPDAGASMTQSELTIASIVCPTVFIGMILGAVRYLPSAVTIPKVMRKPQDPRPRRKWNPSQATMNRLGAISLVVGIIVGIGTLIAAFLALD